MISCWGCLKVKQSVETPRWRVHGYFKLILIEVSFDKYFVIPSHNIWIRVSLYPSGNSGKCYKHLHLFLTIFCFSLVNSSQYITVHGIFCTEWLLLPGPLRIFWHSKWCSTTTVKSFFFMSNSQYINCTVKNNISNMLWLHSLQTFCNIM